jgi:hypothetical protein
VKEISTYKGLLALMEELAWGAEDSPLPSQQMAAAYTAVCAEDMYGPLDEPVVNLVEALNRVDGIRTCLSCCGHEEDPYYIWFNARSVDAVRPLFGKLRPYRGWSITMDPKDFTFELQGPKGERAYREADELAAAITDRKEA